MKTQTIQITTRGENLEETQTRVDEYLYGNFARDLDRIEVDADGAYARFFVTGFERAGWTAEAQVDRLLSGSIGAQVVHPTCAQCVSIGDGHGPRHTASRRCQSGKRPHCTCDACW